MPYDIDDCGDMIIRQPIMQFNNVNRNSRIFPTTRNEGDMIMGNNENNKDNLSNEAIKNLKDITNAVNNFIDHIERDNEANTKNSKVDNSYDNSCDRSNRREDAEASYKSREEHTFDNDLKEFIKHLEEISGHHAEVIPLVPGTKSFEEFLKSMCDICDGHEQCHGCCNDCNDDDDDDEDDDEFYSRIDHMQHAIDSIMRRQDFIIDLIKSDQMARSAVGIPSELLEAKPVASKKRVKKLEKKLDKARQHIAELHTELNMVKHRLRQLEGKENPETKKD